MSWLTATSIAREALVTGKHSYSRFLRRFFLFRRTTSKTAPFGLRIWGRQLTTYPKNFQGGGFAYIDYFHPIRGEMYRALARPTYHFCIHLWKLDKDKTLLVTSLKFFCCFRLNKSVLETAEINQADSQLHFAPKIIEIHLLVFENELIEDAMLAPKKFQNWKLVF